MKQNKLKNVCSIECCIKCKNKKQNKNHFYSFVNRKCVLERKKNCKLHFNKINYLLNGRKRIKQWNQKKKLNYVKRNNVFFLSLHNRKEDEISDEKNIFASIYSKMLEKGKYKNSLLNDVARLFKIIRESKYMFLVGFLLTIISSVVDSFIPIFLSKTLSYVMDRSSTIVQKNNSPCMISLINYFKFNNPIYKYVLISLLGILLSSFRSYIFNVCAYLSTNKLQNHLFRVLLYKHINYFKKKGRGELISRLNLDSSELIDIFTTNIIVLLRNIIKMVLSFYFLYKINVHLFIVSFLIVITISNISIFFSNIFRKLAKEESNDVAYSNNIVEESINNFSLINTFNTHNKEIEKFTKSLDNIYMCRMKLGLLYSIEKLLIRLIDMLTLIVTLILSKRTLKNNIYSDSRTVISSVIYMQNIISQSCTIEQQYSRVQELIGNAEDIIKLIEKESVSNSQNKLSSNKYHFTNLYNFVDIKNVILKYPLIKKFQAIQKNAEYVANIIKPNYLKLFERNYNNLCKLFISDRKSLKEDNIISLAFIEDRQFKKNINGNSLNNTQTNIKEEGIYHQTESNTNNISTNGKFTIPLDEKKTIVDFSQTLKEEVQFSNLPQTHMKNVAVDNSYNKNEKISNILKKNKPDINIQEIYNFIKNEHELIIKYKLDKKFINFLRTKYKKNIILLILKLYEERYNYISEEFLFMFDNISSFKKLSIQDKKSILKLSNITNDTLYIILLTFLFYNYSKFYYKKEKKTPINIVEKKSKTAGVIISDNNISGNSNTSSRNNTSEADYTTIDDISMNDILNDTAIIDLTTSLDKNENATVDSSNSTSNSSSSIYSNMRKNDNTGICIGDTHKISEFQLQNEQEEQKREKTTLSSSAHACMSEEEIMKKTKNKKNKKTKNLNSALPYIIQNAIKELEILKFIDENYKNINENLILDNIKDAKKGSTLVFENVDFYFAKYPKNKILSNINLRFSNKYTYGILCYNDSGKNDLSKLCARLYNKTYGNILLDNENIENISKYILTKKISVVEEETYLFSDSIIYNILYSYNCRLKSSKNLSYLKYNFKFNKININSCVHLFSSDNDNTTNENDEENKKIKNAQNLNKQIISTNEINEQISTNNEMNEQNNFSHFKKCLMCGKEINTKLLEEQRKKKSYNKYKVHFIKKLYKEIIKVSKIVRINDLINSYKNKFFHNINEKILSGGQKQKISLARAIIKKPNILILDEAFNALDSVNELKIFSSIKNYLPNCTIINLSHKITTINRCDYIYVLKDGKIIEQGLRVKLEQNRNSVYAKKLNEI
ncbi:ABC transporter B family member 4, putative (ABCB4) [Plasmodium malariae]|nr:ABC transporter B family member 4, putative (ABCB4) [Plasmodium malariae]